MFPGGLIRKSNETLRAEMVEDGLYVAINPFEVEYDFFSPSPLFPEQVHAGEAYSEESISQQECPQQLNESQESQQPSSEGNP